MLDPSYLISSHALRVRLQSYTNSEVTQKTNTNYFTIQNSIQLLHSRHKTMH